ncbi:MAG: SbcC/MukB-like Walker B domain-containing protein [Candidatus Omnitrophota bacterium]
MRICSSKIGELLSQKKKFTQLGRNGKCPTCFRELGDNYEDIGGHIDSEIKSIKEKLQPIQEKRDKLNKQLEEVIENIDKLVEKKNKLNEKLKRKSRAEQSIEEQDIEIKKLKIKIEKEKEKLEGMRDIKFDQNAYEKLVDKFDALSEIRDTILALRKEIQRIPKINEMIDATEKEIQLLDSQIKQVEDELKKLDFDEGKYDRVKASYEVINDKLSEIQNKLNDSKSQLAVSKQRLINLEEKIDRQKASRNKIEEARAVLQYLQRLESLLESFRLELTSRIRPLLETRASYLFSEITNGRYPSIELDEDYEMSILDGNKVFRLKRFSGGEEDLANLCLRIAMSQVIAERSGGIEINFIALDEIFGSQDEDRRQNILNSLNKLASQFRQIFLITHIEDIKEMLSRVLLVEENITTKESKVSLG